MNPLLYLLEEYNLLVDFTRLIPLRNQLNDPCPEFCVVPWRFDLGDQDLNDNRLVQDLRASARSFERLECLTCRTKT